MRTFQLHRDVDVTGVSGTGIVADGVVWPDGTASVRWRGDRQSVVHWDNAESIEAIHGHGGATRIVWMRPEGVPADLAAIQSRAMDCAQGEIEHWGKGPMFEALDASQRDVGPLMDEVRRLRAIVGES